VENTADGKVYVLKRVNLCGAKPEGASLHTSVHRVVSPAGTFEPGCVSQTIDFLLCGWMVGSIVWTAEKKAALQEVPPNHTPGATDSHTRSHRHVNPSLGSDKASVTDRHLKG
jgi:hypothetical protein